MAEPKSKHLIQCDKWLYINGTADSGHTEVIPSIDFFWISTPKFESTLFFLF